MMWKWLGNKLIRKKINTQSGARRRPSPPALATAATSSGPEISGPSGACTMPYSNPKIPLHPISPAKASWPAGLCFLYCKGFSSLFTATVALAKADEHLNTRQWQPAPSWKTRGRWQFGSVWLVVKKTNLKILAIEIFFFFLSNLVYINKTKVHLGDFRPFPYSTMVTGGLHSK